MFDPRRPEPAHVDAGRRVTDYRIHRRAFLGAGLGALAASTLARTVRASDLLEAQPLSQNAAPPHKVVPGDTLSATAKSHGLDPQVLARIDGLANPSFLQVGQRLALAESSASPAPQVAPAPNPAPVPRDGAIAAPYRSQLDGSVYASANCGPATLGMFLGHFGADYPTAELRESANQQMKSWSADNGTSWEALLYAANVRGYQEHGLYASKGRYRTWTLDDVFDQVSSGHPAMLLVRYKYLPGKEGSSFEGNHYVLVLGRDAAGNVTYHDSAFSGLAGAYRTMSQQQLLKAWSNTSSGINYSAMALHHVHVPRGLLTE